MKEESEAPAAGSSEHTPGPWVFDEDGEIFPLDADGEMDIRREVAAICNNNMEDAKLIAAAPALADALEAMMVDAETHRARDQAFAALSAAGRLASKASAPSGARKSVSERGASLKGK